MGKKISKLEFLKLAIAANEDNIWYSEKDGVLVVKFKLNKIRKEEGDGD